MPLGMALGVGIASQSDEGAAVAFASGLIIGVLGEVIDLASGNIYKPRPNKIGYRLEPDNSKNSENIDRFSVGEKVIFSFEQYKYQPAEIVAKYSEKVTLRVVRPASAEDILRNPGQKEVVSFLEVPYVFLGKIEK